MNALRITEPELVELTEYEQPSRQLEELHRQGFYRARIGRSGRVVLERAHYEAVCAGLDVRQQDRQPRLRPVRAL